MQSLMERRREIMKQKQPIKVMWNQLVEGYMTSDFWKIQSTTYAELTFINGEAVSTLIQDSASGYCSDVQTKNTISIAQNHIFYVRQEIYVSASDKYQIYFGKDYGLTDVVADTWTVLKQRRQHESAVTPYGYFGRSRYGRTRGDTIRTRSPFICDLTAMFGAGNEPSTAEEFEALCTRNGINLNEPQPYNTGTERWWYT